MLSKLLSSGVSNALALGVTFTTTIMLGRLLDPESRGIIAKIMTLIMVAGVLGSFSIPNFIMRQSILKEIKVEVLVDRYRHVTAALAVLTAILSSYFAYRSFDATASAVAATVVAFVVIVESVKGLLFCTATRRADFLGLNLSRVIAPLAYFASLCGFWLYGAFDLHGVLWSFLISQIVAVVPLSRNSDVLGSFFRHRESGGLMAREVISHHTGLALGFLSLQSERLILAFFFSNADVGKFFIAYALCSVPNLLLQPIVPQLIGSGSLQDIKLRSLIATFGAILAGFVLIFWVYGAEIVLLVFGARYADGMGPMVQALSVYMALLSLKQLLLSVITMIGRGGLTVAYVEVAYLFLYIPIALSFGLGSVSALIWINVISVCVPMGLSAYLLKAHYRSA